MKVNFILVILYCFIISCTNADFDELTGDLVGFSELKTLDGIVSEDKAGVEVYLEGSKDKVYTNELGRFVLTDISPGSYNLIMEKEGFGSLVCQNIKIVGGVMPLVIEKQTVFEKASSRLMYPKLEYSNNVFHIRANLLNPENFRVNIFVSSEKDVNWEDYKVSSPYYEYIPLLGNNNFDMYFHLSDMSFITSSGTVYIAIYSSNLNENECVNLRLNKKYFNSYEKLCENIEFTISHSE
ncbi:MAG: carboxypeptidase-like regulatory domain-containing protein [Marinifilaceae bacterium]|jgi:hypothetical protein|nr:carboxypeptidase-like regulatory domain-containing protein [Marinifilaceae bacterium]